MAEIILHLSTLPTSVEKENLRILRPDLYNGLLKTNTQTNKGAKTNKKAKAQTFRAETCFRSSYINVSGLESRKEIPY